MRFTFQVLFLLPNFTDHCNFERNYHSTILAGAPVKEPIAIHVLVCYNVGGSIGKGSV